jgi:hypothetical protein
MATIVNQITQALMTEMKILWRNGGTKGLYPFDKDTPENKRKKAHALDNAFQTHEVMPLTPELNYFEIGNAIAEFETPHYHILEDSKKIRMPNMGTEKSRGSQRKVERSKRDYSVLGYAQGTKTVVQEYRQDFRRNYHGQGTLNTTPREFSKRQAVANKNKRNYRDNEKYFGYIGRLAEEAGQNIAGRFNARFTTSTDSTIAVGDLNPNFRGS